MPWRLGSGHFSPLFIIPTTPRHLLPSHSLTYYLCAKALSFIHLANIFFLTPNQQSINNSLFGWIFTWQYQPVQRRIPDLSSKLSLPQGCRHSVLLLLLLLPSCFSRVRLCATPWQPTRLLRPWDSPGKNTGVGCHFLLQCVKVKSESEATQSCPTLSDPMDCSLPGRSAHGIFQARVLEWGAIAFSCHSVHSTVIHYFTSPRIRDNGLIKHVVYAE